MNPHPDLDLGTLGPNVLSERALSRARRLDCVARAPEDDEEGLCLAIDDSAPVVGERLVEQAAMRVDYLAVTLTETPLEFRRTLNVREEKRDSAVRKLGHVSIVTRCRA
jgi:hypothetical protein